MSAKISSSACWQAKKIYATYWRWCRNLFFEIVRDATCQVYRFLKRSENMILLDPFYGWKDLSMWYSVLEKLVWSLVFILENNSLLGIWEAWFVYYFSVCLGATDKNSVIGLMLIMGTFLLKVRISKMNCWVWIEDTIR